MRGTVVIFRLPKNTESTELNKFCQRFYGQDTSSWKGRYRYHRHGLLDEIPHRKLLRGVIIIESKHLETILKFLKRYLAEVHFREVELTEGDCKFLKLPLK